MTEHGHGRREPAQVVAVVVGVLFVVAGLLGLGPGLLDNVVHLAFGGAALAMSRGARGARAFLIAGGVAYFLLWQFGGVVDPALVPFRTGVVGVHLSFVASMIGLAVLSGGRRAVPVTMPVTVRVPSAMPLAAAPEAGYRAAPGGFARRRQAPNRPPSRSRW